MVFYTKIPLEFHGLVNNLKKMKESKVARTSVDENDDLKTMVEIIRDGKPVCSVVAPQVDRDMGLHVVQIGAEVFEATECWFMSDSHISHSKEGPDGKPWGPGAMQRACDQEGACELGLITDCLMVYGRTRDRSREYLITVPYHINKTAREVHWIDKEAECKLPNDAEDSRIEGLIPDVFEECFANDTLHTLIAKGNLPELFAPLAKDLGNMPEDERLAHADVAAMKFLTMQGFAVMATQPANDTARAIYAEHFGEQVGM